MNNPKLKKIDMEEGDSFTIRHNGSDVRSIFITADYNSFKVTGMQNCKGKTYRYHVLGVDEVGKLSIVSRIQNCLCSFKLNNSKREESLYLGRNEISDLNDWLSKNVGTFKIKNIKDFDRFLGMTVYIINADTHMVIV